MNWIEFLCSIFTGIFENDPLTDGMFGEEFGDIISFAVHNHPARVLGAVLSNLCARELRGHGEQISEEYCG